MTRAAHGRTAAWLIVTCALALALGACGGSSEASEAVKPVRITGTGNVSIPSITVVRGSELYWHTEGSPMHISGQGLALGGGQRAGAAIVPPGTYSNVHVSARGDWSIEVR
ncbi:MAG TPA: hypothetical protein VMB05_11540 [Solirubrobacteraceae bacterium]|nr:hypothetical protein [Solirubrobacteraceae bacterium]